MKLKPKNLLNLSIILPIFLIVIFLLFVPFSQKNILEQTQQLFSNTSSQSSTPYEGKVLSVEKVELADSPDEQEHGLMYRSELCEKCIMLFAFSNNSVKSFWMKNTLISLDIIFLNSDGRIVAISTNTTPGQISPTYSSNEPAQFVIEGSAGVANRLSVKEGDVINISHLVRQSVPMEKVRR